MGRRSFSKEFKVEAVRLIRDRGVSVAQAALLRHSGPCAKPRDRLTDVKRLRLARFTPGSVNRPSRAYARATSLPA